MRDLISGFNSNSLEFGGIEFENSGVNEDEFSLISNYGEFAVIKMSMSGISSEVRCDYFFSDFSIKYTSVNFTPIVLDSFFR